MSKATRRVFVYQDASGEHRWRLYATNGKVLADSGEGYQDRGRVIKMARSIFKGTGYRLEYWGVDDYVREAL